MPLRGLITDLDGTLADTLPVCFAAFRRVLREHLGRDYADTEIYALFGPSEEGVLQRLLPERWPRALAEYLAAYREEHARQARPFAGIAAALAALRARGVRLAVVTAKGPGSAAISLEVLGLAELFETVEAGTPAGASKPAGIRRVLLGWGLAPEAVAYLGDTGHDVRAAQATGVLALGAAWAGTVPAAELRAQGAAEVFESVGAFRAWAEERA